MQRFRRPGVLRTHQLGFTPVCVYDRAADDRAITSTHPMAIRPNLMIGGVKGLAERGGLLREGDPVELLDCANARPELSAC